MKRPPSHGPQEAPEAHWQPTVSVDPLSAIQSLYTPVEIEPSAFPFSFADQIVTLGSCFAEDIGRKLQVDHFALCANPFGILYNPLSISAALSTLRQGDSFELEDLHFAGGRWHSWCHHTCFSHTNRHEALQLINDHFEDGVASLARANKLFLTMGTAWLFEHQGQLVANCHGLGRDQFNRRLASVDEIVSALEAELTVLFAANPSLSVVLTVSPVRHLRDGLVENQISKATLILAAHKLALALPRLEYFPAFEIVIDELRDYRFYHADLVHLTATAVDYVYGRFVEKHLTNEALSLLATVHEIA
ncbi:MAG: GSCFA domain-containing protein, partial [Proteobacteria bacterium]|nr:GSCFA domain-containing protein [Pseudomonadota bacterium]